MLFPMLYQDKLLTMKSGHLKKPVKIALLGDNYLFRLSLRERLLKNPEFEIIADADNSRALQFIDRERPAIAVIDTPVSIFRGLRLVSKIRGLAPLTRIIALNVDDNPRCLYRAFRLGCRGFVFKSDSLSELENAIRLVGRGKTYLSPRLASGFISYLMKMADREGPATMTNEEEAGGQALSNPGTDAKQE